MNVVVGRRWYALVAIAVALTFLMAAPPVPLARAGAAGTHESPVPMGRSTTVSWTGIAGVYLDLPSRPEPGPVAVRTSITLGQDTDVAITAIADHDGCADLPGGEDGWECLRVLSAHSAAELEPDVDDRQLNAPAADGGALGLYLVADGPATITITLTDDDLPAMPESTSITATGTIDAVLEQLPCTAAVLCGDEIAYGGATHHLDPDRHAGAIVYATASISWTNPSPQPNPIGVNAVRGCIYPQRFFPGYSTDPADHPQGCETLSASNPNNSASSLLGLALGVARPNQTETHFFHSGSPAPDGSHYVGFQGQVLDPDDVADERRIAAWGVWLHEGIRIE